MKILLLIILPFVWNSSMPFKKGEITCPDSNKIIRYKDFGPWNNVHCIPNLWYRTKRVEKDISGTKYRWIVEFRNDYVETINFNFQLINSYSSTLNVKTTNRMHLKSTRTGNDWFYIDDNLSVQVVVDKLRFGDADEGAYKTCAY